ncbi:transmembrane Mn(2+) transporter [Mucilaginibacter hurinus]|uniref:Transmembrane Mn(2+) transporter n=1 Tax=Mucilaginibacter hurinus TaxID=2201324 RepID=A0A367GNC4_9SPHI|nr:divalent metal cation transporter [Mucilaginibacter hurinus]RCH54984.1 transmembrane Mn(2+) transporter [Mucilaginibacter hurinus]
MKTEADQQAAANSVIDPPRSFLKTLKYLGPGIIIAGSIVGSGELIATTLLGAEAGFTLLWLILIGCIIKIFTQVEFGRHTVIWSKTPLDALNGIPGPRTKRANWILWYWAGMTCLIITQQGGILGGVGQAMTMIAPLTTEGKVYNQQVSDNIRYKVNYALNSNSSPNTGTIEGHKKIPVAMHLKSPPDVKYWVVIIAIITSVTLYFGRFNIIQWASTIMVFMFTVTSFINIGMLQSYEKWAIKWNELVSGLSFNIPDGSGVAIGLATFGLIGMSSSELMTYPYWCIEKGYAKFTGKKDGSAEWIKRAKGWIKIMRIDSLACMVVYTFSTVAFYVMGAAVLGRIKLMPEKTDLIMTLSEMYVPVFGSWAQTIFVTGSIAVLYSTFFLAGAGNSRMVVDGLKLFGVLSADENKNAYRARVVSAIWPLSALGLYMWFEAPLPMVLWSGVAQSLMLPMLGFAALTFRYRYMVDDLKPGRLWDVFLWISCAGMFVVGFWVIYSEVFSK